MLFFEDYPILETKLSPDDVKACIYYDTKQSVTITIPFNKTTVKEREDNEENRKLLALSIIRAYRGKKAFDLLVQNDLLKF